MKKLPVGIQTFSEIISGNYLYIDKTKLISQLIFTGKYHFISRPRRFGKSLLITTLKEIFSGNRELFKGLWIYDKIEWKTHPIIHIDFSGISYETPQALRSSIDNRINDLLLENNLEINPDKNYKEKFKDLIKFLAEKEKAVILIDEYDKPLVEFVDKPETALENRSILKNFYETIKESDQYIRFVLLTGVSKFSRVSVFSGLNNLLDLTLDEKFSTLFGYTEAELNHYFADYLNKMADKFQLVTDNLKAEIKNWYNGYSWDGKNFVYNPYSILSLFYHESFSNYWFTSGTPTFLIKLIKERNFNIEELENMEVLPYLFDAFEIDNINIESLLFQTGYLTIKEVIEYSFTDKAFILNYPNKEIKESLLRNILNSFADKGREKGILVHKILMALNKNDLEGFFKEFKVLFSEIPAEIFMSDREAYYHTIIYLVLTLIGIRINTEVHTNKGRIDAVIETGKTVYVFEFKLKSSKAAIKQIEKKKYYEKFLNSGKEILLVGVGFDTVERNIKDWALIKVD